MAKHRKTHRVWIYGGVVLLGYTLVSMLMTPHR